MQGAAGTARGTGPGEERVRRDQTGIPEGPSGRGEETGQREETAKLPLKPAEGETRGY